MDHPSSSVFISLLSIYLCAIFIGCSARPSVTPLIKDVAHPSQRVEARQSPLSKEESVKVQRPSESICVTGQAIYFDEAKEKIVKYIKDFKSVLGLIAGMEPGMNRQMQRAHFFIQFDQGLLLRLTLLRNYLEGCLPLENNYLKFRTTLIPKLSSLLTF
jgi:hypothetical protein